MATQSHVFSDQWKGDKELNNTVVIMLASFPTVPLTRCRLTPPFQGAPANIRINVYCQKLESLGYIFVADSVGLSSFKFLLWALKDASFL